MTRGALLLLLVLTATTRADGPLTPKEAAEGWIALFDGKTTFGWTAPTDSQWTILDGMLAPQKGKEGLLVTTTAFADFTVEMEVRKAAGGKVALLTTTDPKEAARARSESVVIPDDDSSWGRYHAEFVGGYLRAENYHSARKTIGSGTVKAVDLGGVTPRPVHLVLKGNGFVVRNLKLKPRLPHSLFNGKDLSGWKEHPGQRSKFTVTPEGWLSIKDGRGDLQTEQQWADFVLQLECKSNGKHLNSGVFFRCLPDQYQMGYEAQIHNGFGPEREIDLEVFDPETMKVVKRKEKVTALDFGTGAIYRRKPARFQAARDEEWFTMTVVARGRHLATWVNGIQMVDWTDPRPLAENARKGAYLKKGPLSLQGHDPTTDLLFRNLRVTELPASK